MVDVKLINYGSGAWLIGWFIIFVSQYIFPILLNLLYINDTIDSVYWIGIVLMWFLLVLVVPIGLYIVGLKKDDSKIFNIMGIAYAGIHFFVSIILLYLTYYIHEIFIGLIHYDILKILYWVSVIVVFIFNVLVIPIYIIINTKNE